LSLSFIAEATAADADALVAVEERCSSHPWTRRHFVAEMDPALRTRTLVVRRLDQSTGALAIVAFCSIRRVADEVHVENLGVHPDHRRQGLGRLLLRTSLGVSTGDGARVAFLEVRVGNETARRLYEAEGFKVAGERRGYYSEPLEDAVILLRPLQDPC
jgi:[ribosomal protein S18]-alanine N-acetyltransferase